MNYVFTDLIFRILGISEIFLNSEFQEFRSSDDIKPPNCILNVNKTPALKRVVSNSVFSSEQGFIVFENNTGEIRLFIDYYSGSYEALLEDYGKEKNLWILETKAKNWSERRLLNCLGLEKTMNEFERIILHASFIEIEKGAVLFTAPSGTGKSTQAMLWEKYRKAEIINGDRVGIWKAGNEWMAGGIPWNGTSGIAKNKNIPIKLIVVLKQGNENIVSELMFIKKVSLLLKQTIVNPWNSHMFYRTEEILLKLCTEVQIVQFACRPDQEAVEVLAKELGI